MHVTIAIKYYLAYLQDLASLFQENYQIAIATLMICMIMELVGFRITRLM